MKIERLFLFLKLMKRPADGMQAIIVGEKIGAAANCYSGGYQISPWDRFFWNKAVTFFARSLI